MNRDSPRRRYPPTLLTASVSVMRCKLYIIVLVSVFSYSFSVAAEADPYLIAVAKHVQLPNGSGIKMDLVPNILTYSFRARRYMIDSKMRKAYPTGMKEVIGPSNEGFIITIAVGPKNNLPMSRHNGIYSERNVSHPYWKERVYGYETPQGAIVVSVEEGLKMEKNRLLALEVKVKEHLSQWVNEQ